jgi:uncharacterized lipoprotein YbaY
MLQVAGYDTAPAKVLGTYHVYAKTGCPLYFAFRIDKDAIEASHVHNAIRRLFPELDPQAQLAGA